MSVNLPTIAWETRVSDTAIHATDYNYTCTIDPININDPGYGELVVGYYLVDYIGHIFRIEEIISGYNIRVYDLIEDTQYTGPYNDQVGFVYKSLYEAALLAQGKINELDKSAEDFIRNLILDPKIFDSIQFNTDYIHVDGDPEGLLHWNPDDNTLDIHTGYGTTLQVGQEIHIKVYNNTGSTISDGVVVYPTGSFNDYPTIGLAVTDSHETINLDYGITTTSMDNGEYGFVTWFGKVRGLDTSSFNVGDSLYISADNPGELVNVKPSFPNYIIQAGICFISDAIDGEIFVTGRDSIYDTFNNFWNGTFRESINFAVTSDGTTITGTLTPSDGHPDMTMVFSDGFTMLDTSPGIEITLTPGTDDNPQENYIYIPQSTKLLTVSTSFWPTGEEYIKVATVVLRTAATTQLYGALKNQNWNDHLENHITHQGHLSHITNRLRQEPAKWDDGVEATTTIVTASNPDDIYLSVTSGHVYQMHRQTFPALDMSTGDVVHIVNNFATPYKTTTNLNTEILDALGNTLKNKKYSIVVWGIQNRTGETSQLMVNLPLGSYTSAADAINDANNYSVYSIPKMFQGTGFLIARFTFTNSVNNSWTLEDYQDLRGFIPNTTAGSGGGGAGVTTWLALSDTPNTYLDQAYKIPQVNAGESDLEFLDTTTDWLSQYTLLAGRTGDVLKIDEIDEFTLDAGVTIDSVLIKDGFIASSFISGLNETNWDTAYTHSQITTGNPHNISLTDIGESQSSINYWAQSGNDIYYNTGDVGIGTDSPNELLDLSSRSSGLRISASDDSHKIRGSMQASSGNGGFFELYDDDEIKNVLIRGYGDSYFNGGDVGIGTTSPDYKLDVSGTIRLTDKLYLGTTTAPATDTGTLNALVWDNTTGEVKQRAIPTYNQVSIASDTTPNPTGNYRENEYYLTALAGNATFAAPSGTAANGNTLLIRIEDNGTARTLAWNSIYRVIGTTLPTTTVLGKILYLGMIYNSTDTKWDVVSVVQEV